MKGACILYLSFLTFTCTLKQYFCICNCTSCTGTCDLVCWVNQLIVSCFNTSIVIYKNIEYTFHQYLCVTKPTYTGMHSISHKWFTVLFFTNQISRRSKNMHPFKCKKLPHYNYLHVMNNLAVRPHSKI